MLNGQINLAAIIRELRTAVKEAHKALGESDARRRS